MKVGRGQELLGKGGVERLASLGSSARTLTLAVTDLGAGAKEVTAVLADAGITRFSADGPHRDSTGPLNDRPPAPKPAAPSAKLGADELTGFSLVPGGGDELRFIVMATPDRIEAVTKRLDSLRQSDNPDVSSNGLCISGVSRPAAVMPKAVSTQSAGPPLAKTATGSPGEPYHEAELQRLPNPSQIEARQSQAVTAPTAQGAGAPAPRNETIIITVRLRHPDANRADPGRNLKQ